MCAHGRERERAAAAHAAHSSPQAQSQLHDLTDDGIRAAEESVNDALEASAAGRAAPGTSRLRSALMKFSDRPEGVGTRVLNKVKAVLNELGVPKAPMPTEAVRSGCLLARARPSPPTRVLTPPHLQVVDAHHRLCQDTLKLVALHKAIARRQREREGGVQAARVAMAVATGGSTSAAAAAAAVGGMGEMGVMVGGSVARNSKQVASKGKRATGRAGQKRKGGSGSDRPMKKSRH